MNVTAPNGQRSATAGKFIDSHAIYINCIDGQLCLAKTDGSLFSQSVPLLLLLGTPEPTK